MDSSSSNSSNNNNFSDIFPLAVNNGTQFTAAAASLPSVENTTSGSPASPTTVMPTATVPSLASQSSTAVVTPTPTSTLRNILSPTAAADSFLKNISDNITSFPSTVNTTSLTSMSTSGSENNALTQRGSNYSWDITASVNESWSSTNWTNWTVDGNSTPWPDNNVSTTCSNDYCVSDEEYIDMILSHIYPQPFEFVLIAAYIVIFIVGLSGNILVCFAVWRNQSMRTVTNYFIVNLAVADIMVILICLPPTVIGDITETWFLGSVMCKIVKYLQGVSVSVSVLTLSSISVERWYAICYPLLFRSTPYRAKIIIIVVWVVSILLILPELIVVDTHPLKPEVTILLTLCKPTWSDNRQSAYQLFLMVTVYCLPLMLMFVTYFQIACCLWTTAIPTETSRDHLKPHDYRHAQESQLQSRRKVAKMLIAVVVMFGFCYLPVHLLNIFRYASVLDKWLDWANYFALVAHWLCYFNSAINPVIYNFMSAKFRKEFSNACQCRCRRGSPLRHRGTAMYSYRYSNTFRTQNTQHTALHTGVRHHQLAVRA